MLEEEKDKEQSEQICSGNEEGKGSRAQKTCQWNAGIKKVLFQVVKMEPEGYGLERNESQSREDCMEALLDTEAQTLWP